MIVLSSNVTVDPYQVSGSARKKAKKSHEQDVVRTKILRSVEEKENRQADTTVTQVREQPNEPNVTNILKIKKQHANNTTDLTGAVQHPKSALQKVKIIINLLLGLVVNYFRPNIFN